MSLTGVSTVYAISNNTKDTASKGGSSADDHYVPAEVDGDHYEAANVDDPYQQSTTCSWSGDQSTMSDMVPTYLFAVDLRESAPFTFDGQEPNGLRNRAEMVRRMTPEALRVLLEATDMMKPDSIVGLRDEQSEITAPISVEKLRRIVRENALTPHSEAGHYEKIPYDEIKKGQPFWKRNKAKILVGAAVLALVVAVAVLLSIFLWSPEENSTTLSTTTTHPTTTEMQPPTEATILLMGDMTFTDRIEYFFPLNVTAGYLSSTKLHPDRRAAVAGVLNGKVILTGGISKVGFNYGPVLNDTAVYDTVTGLWHSGPQLSTPRWYATGAVLGDKFLVCGGLEISQDYGPALDTCEYLGVGAESWIETPPMTEARYMAASAVLDQYFYIFGGYYNFSEEYYQPVATGERFSFATNAWEVLTPMAKPRGGFAAAAFDGAIWVCGGMSKFCYRYLPNKDAWESAPSLVVPRSRFGLAVVENELYAIAGGVTTMYFNDRTVEVFSTANNTWGKIKGAFVKPCSQEYAMAVL